MSINPNSLKNLVSGGNKRPDAIRVTVWLNPETIKLAKQLGDGKTTKGLDKMAELMSDWIHVTKRKITNDYQYNATKNSLEGCQEMLKIWESYPIPENENNRPFYKMRIDKLHEQINNYIEEIKAYENK